MTRRSSSCSKGCNFAPQYKLNTALLSPVSTPCADSQWLMFIATVLKVASLRIALGRLGRLNFSSAT
jgi:hypothetical protein